MLFDASSHQMDFYLSLLYFLPSIYCRCVLGHITYVALVRTMFPTSLSFLPIFIKPIPYLVQK